MSEDYKGKRFGEWLVIDYVPKNKGMKKVICQCSCSKIFERYLKHLKSGASQSCGHNSLKEVGKKVGKSNLKYSNINLSNTRLYNAWNNMKSRCNNEKNLRYEDYGGRGIKICQEWLEETQGFINFYNWAINNGYREDLTIDRIDNNGNYEPNNCRWVTAKIQANNRRKDKNSRYLTYKGITKTAKEWCNEYNINYSTLSCRINKLNWSDEQALKDFVERSNYGNNR